MSVTVKLEDRLEEVQASLPPLQARISCLVMRGCWQPCNTLTNAIVFFAALSVSNQHSIDRLSSLQRRPRRKKLKATCGSEMYA